MSVNKLCLFLLLSYFYNFPQALQNLIRTNFSSQISILEYYPFLFFLLPGFYIIVNTAIKNTIRIPYIRLFIFFIFFYWLLDNPIIRDRGSVNYSFLYLLIIIYSGFIFLTNLNFNIYTNYIVKYSLIIVSILFLLNLLGLLGYVSIGTTVLESNAGLNTFNLANSRFASELVHLNGLSINYLICIYLLFEYGSSIFKNKYYVYILIIFFISGILVNGSRGVFLLLLIGLLYYLLFNNNIHRKKLLGFLLILPSEQDHYLLQPPDPPYPLNKLFAQYLIFLLNSLFLWNFF